MDRHLTGKRRWKGAGDRVHRPFKVLTTELQSGVRSISYFCRSHSFDILLDWLETSCKRLNLEASFSSVDYVTQWHESWHACQDAWVCLPRSWQDLAKILPRLPWSCKIMARLTMRLTKRTKIFHVSYQAFPCVLPSIPRFFYPSCQSNQDFFMHFAKHSKIFVVTCKA